VETDCFRYLLQHLAPSGVLDISGLQHIEVQELSLRCIKSSSYQIHDTSRSREVKIDMKAKIKNGFHPKVCVRCGLEFEWRKKWARDWENVKYCSERCKAGK
jgi:hypothetical protein